MSTPFFFFFMMFMPLLQKMKRQNTSCLHDIHLVLCPKQYCSENDMYSTNSASTTSKTPRFQQRFKKNKGRRQQHRRGASEGQDPGYK
ncbi:hypothetical protein E2C01_006046 [Portunus trituberculatus]|uniref:Secreted protein n=1 Tax=Portunus trituberculatus TaxID=210409 RepID=A0A5B7CW20_PORTR|nr:hypothetical protein [Portunus trituberculatus]